MRRESKLKRKALALIREIKGGNSQELAKKTIKLMKESVHYREQRKKLFKKYKRDLLRDKSDDRLDPTKSIEYGFKYFARMLNAAETLVLKGLGVDEGHANK